MFELQYAVYTHPGKIRDHNEDNYYVDGKWKQELEQNISKAAGAVKGNYFVASVCDGMGGEELGEVASLTAVETIQDYLEEKRTETETETAHKCIVPVELVNLANERICQMMQEEGKRSGSTMTVLEITGTAATMMNVGDSRGFWMRDGILNQITVDHTVVQRMVRLGQITKEESRTHPLGHQLTQYLGIYEDEMILEPTVSEQIRIKTGDIFLLCSDGLTDMLTEAEIFNYLMQSQTLEDAAEALVDQALAAGGKDNVTVVLIRIGEEKNWKNVIRQGFQTIVFDKIKQSLGMLGEVK